MRTVFLSLVGTLLPLAKGVRQASPRGFICGFNLKLARKTHLSLLLRLSLLFQETATQLPSRKTAADERLDFRAGTGTHDVGSAHAIALTWLDADRERDISFSGFHFSQTNTGIEVTVGKMQ
jgi:hypothetical protein